MGWTDNVPIDLWIRLSNGLYWVAKCMLSEGGLSLCSIDFIKIRHRPFVTCVCAVEGCGLLADS